MGHAEAQNRQSVLSKVQECLEATNVAIATTETVAEKQNALVEDVARIVAGFQTDLNAFDERFGQYKRGAAADLASQVERLEKQIGRVGDAAAEAIYFTVQREAEARQANDVRIATALTKVAKAIEDANALASAHRTMGFWARVKWFFFGVLPRPAGAPMSSPAAAAPIEVASV